MPAQTSEWDPLSAENLADPIAVQREMRAKCPVAWTDQFGGGWGVFKWENLEEVAGNAETFSAAEAFVVPDMTGGVFPWLPVQSNPPLHTHYRDLVSPFFRGSRIAEFEPELVRIANECIDSFIGKGRCDVATELNYPVTTSALAMLMGLPAEEGRTFRGWHEGMVAANAAQDLEALGLTFMEILNYVNGWMEKRKAEPSDDLMSALLSARIEDRPLTNEEILGNFILLIVGGFETTADATSSTLQYLSTDRAMCDRLRENPKTITKAVGEFARIFAPVQSTARTATCDVTLGGREIKKGERILQMWASGSRDEDVFPHPDVCDIDRPGTAKLTSFGAGVHRCLGEGLARIEMRAILSTWLDRIDTFEVDGTPERGQWPTQGWHYMPLKFTPRS